MATLVPQTVFTKTAKGILEIRNKSTRLPRELSALLELVDGTASVVELSDRSGLATLQLNSALGTLAADGYIKAVATAAHVEPRDPDAVRFDSPSEATKLNTELAAHALASAEAAKVMQQEGRAALEARLRAEAEGRARALAEARVQAEAEARATADAAARAAQHARDEADQAASAASDPEARAQAQTDARNAATAALRARAEAQARAEAEERARAVAAEKKSAEQRAREEAQAHSDAEQRARERAAAETRARDALQAQLDAATAVREHDDPAARARLHEIEAEAERARAEAGLVAESQGLATQESTENLHFDDLAQRLTARVTAERRAREEAGRGTHRTTETAAADNRQDALPPLEFSASEPEASRPVERESSAAPEALPSIDLASTAGRGDVKHITPDHVPSALERAMMEREARAEAEKSNDGVAAPPARPAVTTHSGSRAAAPPTFTPVTLSLHSPEATYEPKPGASEAATTSAADPDAPQKISPTLVEDKNDPVQERLNVDRTAHDVMADAAEERRKAELASLNRQAIDMRRQRQEEEARRVAREERELKRRKLARVIGIAAVGIPLLVVAWLQFVPLNGYVPDAQQALTARLNQPTTVSTVRYVLLPTPRIVLEGVRIGSAQAVHVERVDVHAWPWAFLAGPLVFDTAEASGVTIDPGMLATIPAWTGGRSANAAHVSNLKLSDVKLGGPDAKMEGLNGEVVFAANGTVSHANLASDKIQLEVSPLQSGVLVALNARDWRVPFGPGLTFTYFTAEGVVDKEHFSTTRLEARVGGGTITGSLAARWDGPTIVGGDLKIEGVRIDEPVQQLAPGFRVKGVLNSNVRYAMQADTASGLMARPMVEGTFTIARGELGGVDLARAVQLPGTPVGGRTAFDELKGSVRIDGDRYSYRNVQLSSGPLEATAAIDVVPGGQLSGRVDAQIATRSTVAARTSFTVRGTVKDPQIVR
jgi:hypothetical protein